MRIALVSARVAVGIALDSVLILVMCLLSPSDDDRHQMYADNVKPNVYVFNSLITVYARAMTKLKGKPPPETVEDRADGRELLKPPKPQSQEGDLGHGSVLVEGDMDVSGCSAVLSRLVRCCLLRAVTDTCPGWLLCARRWLKTC